MKQKELHKTLEKLKSFKLLYVEDDKTSQLIVLKILETFFDTIITTSNGKEAYKLFNKHRKDNPFDIIITDIDMPIMDGIELAKRIRKKDEFIPLLFLSSHENSKYFLDSIDIGIDGYLYKPFDFDKFMFYIKRIVKNLKLKNEQQENLKLQNKKLKNLNYKYEYLLKTLNKNVIYSRTDLSGNIIEASDAFCKVSGYTKKELIGQAHSIIRHPDMEDTIFAHMWNTISQEIPWEGDIKNKHKDNSHYWVHTYIEPYYDQNNNHIGYTSVRKNIAAQKEIERLNYSLELKVEERTKNLELAKQATETLHKHTRESIEYASLIQSSLVPSNNKVFRQYFDEYFVIWHPKDIVGGDIYFFEQLSDDECIIMVIDCTGHGVPGAFVTILVKSIQVSIINHILANPDEKIDTAKMLSKFSKDMKKLLQQEDKDSSISNTGFDGGILYYNKKESIIKYSGANTPLFYVENDQLNVIASNKHSVGYKRSDPNYKYTEYDINTSKGMSFYITTDGYLDQNGGQKGFPFGKRRFKEIINSYHIDSMADQQEMFLYEIAEYENDQERNDDITVIGFKI
jgi:PAS domain S-box-containing protein